MDHNAYGERHVRKKSFLVAIISAGVTALAMAAIVIVCVLNLRTCGSSYEKEINITTNLKTICNRAIKENKGLDYKVKHLSLDIKPCPYLLDRLGLWQNFSHRVNILVAILQKKTLYSQIRISVHFTP